MGEQMIPSGQDGRRVPATDEEVTAARRQLRKARMGLGTDQSVGALKACLYRTGQIDDPKGTIPTVFLDSVEEYLRLLN